MIIDAKDKFRARRVAAFGHRPDPHCLYLAEYLAELSRPADFNVVERMGDEAYSAALRSAVRVEAAPYRTLFEQGDPHHGLYLIESGSVRTYYLSADGRKIPLATWGAGHFVGGPQVFSEGEYIWSCEVVEPVSALLFSDADLRSLAESSPAFALALIDGFSTKARVYSSLVHMLNTSSLTGRLAQFIVLLGDMKGIQGDSGIEIRDTPSVEALSDIIGATPDRLAAALNRLHRDGMLFVLRHKILICDARALNELAAS